MTDIVGVFKTVFSDLVWTSDRTHLNKEGSNAVGLLWLVGPLFTRLKNTVEEVKNCSCLLSEGF